jgi:hypothetical protein
MPTMVFSSSKAIWSSLSSEQKTEITAIAAGWQVSTQMEADTPMEETADNEPAPPSLLANAGIPMGDARAQYIEMVLEERRAAFQQAQAEQEYNLRLLDKHWHAKEEHITCLAIASNVDVGEQKALLESFCTAHEIRRDRWRFRVPRA